MTPRLPLLDDSQVGPPDLVAAIRARRGGALLDLDRLLLHSPPFAAGWGELMGRVRGALELPPRLRELAMCGVAVITGAAFEVNAHAQLFEAEGGSAAQVDALYRLGQGTANDPVFDASQQAVLALVVEMTQQVDVREATFTRAREVLGSDRRMFELVATIAAYNMVGRILVALKLGQ
jgi:AhpD family alkylhydroperoxidase